MHKWWRAVLRGRPITEGELEDGRLRVPIGVAFAISDVPGTRGSLIWALVGHDGLAEDAGAHDRPELARRDLRVILVFRRLSCVEWIGGHGGMWGEWLGQITAV